MAGQLGVEDRLRVPQTLPQRTTQLMLMQAASFPDSPWGVKNLSAIYLIALWNTVTQRQHRNETTRLNIDDLVPVEISPENSVI